MTFAEKIVDSIDEFPTLPSVYLKLTEVMQNPSATAKDVAAIISSDPASAIKVLKAVNAPIYGLRGKIDSIIQAVTYLGFNEIKNLVLALSIIKMFDKIRSLRNFNIIDFWKHAIGVGIISRHIARIQNIKQIENYLIAGLLHDIGKLVFIIFFYDEYSEIVSYATENDLLIDDVEKDFFGSTHMVVGEILAEKWMLPSSVRQAIRHHGSGTGNGKYPALVAAVHIGDCFARTLKLGNSGDRLITRPNMDSIKVLDLPNDYFTANWQVLIDEYSLSTNILLN